ncbi:MAG TPA: Xaa-Pro peptidase family protein [Gemmatimonadales bacterium]|jgi:Xaa-Pro dipeptidase|nr:Xaa-Pro peptidase family protein [Gemmatimonadales bacterium]
MPTRREFLGVSTGAVAALVAPAFPPAPPELAPEAAAAPLQGAPSALPPSIQALTSQKARAHPITVEERGARLDQARRLLAAEKLDALLLTGGTSLDYFTGIRWGLSERLLALVLPGSGRAFIVCPAFEKDRAMEQIAAGPLKGDADVMTWEEHESPYRLIADGLRARGITGGRLGVEETVRWVFSSGAQAAMPAVALASGTPVTAGCRMVKSPHEIELMRLAAEVTLTAYEAAWKALADGMTQNDFARLVSAAHDKLGFQGGAGVQVGAYSALPHGSATKQVVRPGSILLIDGGGTVEGYESDISRTFVLGKATDRMKQVFEIEQRAQKAALAAARPGVECQAVDAAARKVITDAGFGPDYKYFTHRVGHGMGMDGHEWPYLVRGNTLPLQAHMTTSDEPGIYIPGEFGVRLEDDMHVTESGAELFTPTSPSLEEPFAR